MSRDLGIRSDGKARQGMRLVRFFIPGARRACVGVLVQSENAVVNLSAALRERYGDLHSMRDFLELGQEALAIAEQEVNGGTNRMSLADVKLTAPVAGCDKVLCIGMNYVDHCTEQNYPIPEEPIIFNKFASCIIGPGDPIPYTREMRELDFEVELVIVIGKAGKHISKEKAMEHVAGYTVTHDVSERFWQLKKNGAQWLVGKAFDGFCPLGPSIVTPEELGDAHKLGIRCLVNGKSVQDSNTDQLIFKTEHLVSFCSRFFTLLPGDIIQTGTPPGVGVFRKPPMYLKVGDVVTCEIDGIGSISNPVVAEEELAKL